MSRPRRSRERRHISRLSNAAAVSAASEDLHQQHYSGEAQAAVGAGHYDAPPVEHPQPWLRMTTNEDVGISDGEAGIAGLITTVRYASVFSSSTWM